MIPLPRPISTRRTLAIAQLFAVVMVSGAAIAETPVSWLMRLNNASMDLNYQGSFIYRHGNQVEAMRIVHRNSSSGVDERLYSLSGASREIIRDQSEVWCYLPDEKRGVHQSRELGKSKGSEFPSLLPESVSDLQQFYSFELGQTTRIAEREAQRIDIIPKDGYRYGRMLWIDVKTGLLLRADLVNQSGNAVEQYMFVEVDYDADITDEDLTPSTPRSELVWHEPPNVLKAVDEKSHWSAANRPDGFRLIEYMRKPGTTQDSQVHHLVYTDGLATVSVFIDNSTNSDAERITGDSTMGAVNAFGTMAGGAQVTAIGEVPLETVRLLAGAMSRQ